MIEALRPWIALQAIITLFLVLVLRLLYAYVHQQRFFRWWLWGWACFAVSLIGGWVVMGEVGRTGLPTMFLILVSVVAAWMQIACFIVGARMLLPDPLPTAWTRLAIAVAFAAALLTLAVSRTLHVSAYAAYCIRAAPRHLALALAYFYCAVHLWRWARQHASSGATIAAVACAPYGVSQLWRFMDLANIPVPGVALTDSYTLFLLDFVCEGGIIVGMMLLLLQQNQELQQRLHLYQAIVPTCSMCGAVRDDLGFGHGAGPWMPLGDYVSHRTSAKFSHTFCPNCLPEYRRRQGLPAQPEKPKSQRTAAVAR